MATKTCAVLEYMQRLVGAPALKGGKHTPGPAAGTGRDNLGWPLDSTGAYMSLNPNFSGCLLTLAWKLHFVVSASVQQLATQCIPQGPYHRPACRCLCFLWL